MKHIQKILTASNTGVLSMEEIEEQIDAAEPVENAVEVVAETPALEEEPSDPLDGELDAVAKDGEEFSESVDELETAGDVVDKLEETTQVMESLLDKIGSVSLVEYVSLSEFASNQFARLGIQHPGFAAEGIETDAGRLENLRFSTEAIKQSTEDVKKAIKTASKKVNDHSTSLWEKLLAVLGNQVLRTRVLMEKVEKAGELSREEVNVSARLMGSVVNDDPTGTAKAINKACTFFYGPFFNELREWSAKRSDTVPTVPANILDGLPGNPTITLTEKSAEFDHNSINGTKGTVKTMSKSDIKQMLTSIKSVIEDVRKAGARWMTFGDQLMDWMFSGKWLKMIPGSGAVHGMLKELSRGHRCVSMVYSAYVYFTTVINNLLKYAGVHIAAYK